MKALLALFLRSLREGMRARATYFARAGLVAFVIAELITVHASSGWSGAPGLALFNIVITTDLLFVSLVGLSYFASAIAEEKEEMTLGLLRMTDLNPLSILLGKSTSRLCGVLLLLASQLPFTLLAVTFGGVTASQVVAAYACLGAFIFFLANLSLIFSVIARRTAGAAIATALTLLALFIAPGVIAWLCWALNRAGWRASPQPGPWLTDFLTLWNDASPFTRLAKISATGFRDGPFCWQVGSNVVLGLACFAIAWAAFHRFADQPGEVAPPRTMTAQRTSPFAFLSAGRTWRRALLWKDFYFIAGGKAVFALRILACVAIGLLIFAPWSKVRPEWSTIGYVFTGVFGSLLILDFAFAASRIFRLERKAQTLSSLALLPMTMRRLAWQKVVAAIFASLPPIACVAFGLAIAVPEALAWMQGELPRTFITTGAGTPPQAFFRSMAWIIAGQIAAMIAGGILMIHLSAWLSLRLKWGAFPIALAIWFVGTQIATVISLMIFSQAGPFIFAAVELFTAVVLHFSIGRRLEELAAED